MAQTHSNSVTTAPQKARLNKYGYNSIARHIFLSFLVTGPLFLGAGTWDWQWAWVYTLLTFIGWIGLSVMVARENPELLNQRGKRPEHMTGTKRWDWIILAVYFILLLAIPFVAGLDYRYGWSLPTNPGVNLTGIVLVILSFMLLTWAMAVNKHFAATVRIQTEGEHKVAASGPYKHVRHPGYAALILGFLGTPLTVGAWVALIPALAAVILFIVRTELEDRTLQRELPGYPIYVRRTRTKLIPGLW